LLIVCLIASQYSTLYGTEVTSRSHCHLPCINHVSPLNVKRCKVACSGPTKEDIYKPRVGSTYIWIKWNAVKFCWADQAPSFQKSYNITIRTSTTKYMMSHIVLCKRQCCEFNATSLKPSTEYIISVHCKAEKNFYETNNDVPVRTHPDPPPPIPTKKKWIVKEVLEYAVGVGGVVLLAASVVLYVARIRENCSLHVVGKKRKRRCSDVTGDLNESYDTQERSKMRSDKDSDDHKHCSSSPESSMVQTVKGNLLEDLKDSNSNTNNKYAPANLQDYHRTQNKKRRLSNNIAFHSRERLPPIEDVPSLLMKMMNIWSSL